MMLNRWSDKEAGSLTGVDALLYMSRLVGLDPSLVLWGGGNTSLKVEEVDFRGRPTQVLRVKGSGSDLKAVAAGDFTGVRMDDVLPLEQLDSMTDEEMVEYLGRTIMDPGSPRPSIETLLHAFVPALCVLHSHADAVVALSNSDRSVEALQQALGPRVAIVPYRRPGFILSKEVAAAARAIADCDSVVLMNHGLVSWGTTPREAYDYHLELVSRAETYAANLQKGKSVFGAVRRREISGDARQAAAAAAAPVLRGLLGSDRRVILRYDASPDILQFVNSSEAQRLSQIGPATPDHLLNTKRLPLFVDIGDPTDVPALGTAFTRALDEYRERYVRYVNANNVDGVARLASEPRVVLVPGLGMWTAGRDARAALISGEIYHHTIAVMSAAQSVGAYRSLTERDAFDAEYWPLELYKLTLQPPERPLARQIVLVTGAASGIGRAIAQRFAAEGAHVALTDIDAPGVASVETELTGQFGPGRFTTLSLDVGDESSVAAAFKAVCLEFGGLDVVISNAGIAPSSSLVDQAIEDWHRSLAVNATGHFLVTREALRIMRAQGTGGSLVFIASKNVTAPGADFGAYSAAKAAEAQLARIAAIEGGAFGIRANIINPDAVFEGSKLFDGELRSSRAGAHGIDPSELEEFYRQRNLLKTRVLAEDVAEAALFLAGSQSAKTTGAMLPVDGGVREAFPR